MSQEAHSRDKADENENLPDYIKLYTDVQLHKTIQEKTLTQSQANRQVSDGYIAMNRPAGTAPGTEARASTRLENEKSLGKGSLVSRGSDLNTHRAQREPESDDGSKKPAAKKQKKTRTGVPLKKILEDNKERGLGLENVFKTMAEDSKKLKEQEQKLKAECMKAQQSYQEKKLALAKERNQSRHTKEMEKVKLACERIAAKEKKEANLVELEMRKIQLEERKLKHQEEQAKHRNLFNLNGRLYGITDNPNATAEEKEKAYAKIDELKAHLDDDDF